MSAISWNCRGFASSSTVKELKEVCGKVKPYILFLMETKISSRRMEMVRRRSFSFERSLYVEAEGLSGGLAVWWREDVSMNFVVVSKNIIHAEVVAPFLEEKVCVSFVYGPPSNVGRDDFWDMLGDLKPTEDVAWLCVGDFNDFLYHSEKYGGNPRLPSSFVRFQGWMFDCEMMDLEFKGCKFTWSNGQNGDGLIRERIDRAVCNGLFRAMFPLAIVVHNEMLRSDHCLLVVDLFHKYRRGPKRFRFESFWVEHKEYADTIRGGWCIEDGLGECRPAEEVAMRLKHCEQILKVWGKKNFPNSKNIIDMLKNKMAILKQGQWSDQKAAEFDLIKNEIEERWKVEE